MDRILYVDDQPELLSVARQYLELDQAFQVDTVESVEEALPLLKNITYDAIISDYFMPDIDGLEFLKQVRSINRTIPFIIFTGQGDETVVIEALNNGADFYLKKASETGSQFSELAQILSLAISRAKSEKQSELCNDYFKAVLDTSQDWVYMVSPDGTLVYVSPSIETITGYSADEFYKNPDLVNQIVFEEDHETWFRYIKENKQEDSTELTLRIWTKGGELRWIHHSETPVHEHTGKYFGVHITNRDITDQKRAELLHEEEQENFLKIFNAAPVGLLLINADFEILYANQATRTFVLHDPADVIQKRIGGVIGCIHSREDSRGCGFSNSCPHCPIRNTIEEVISKRTQIHGKIAHLTLLVNNTLTERWLDISAEPVMISGLQHVIVAIDDVTDLKTVQDALLESEEKFRALSENTPAAIMMYQDELWVYANPAGEKISGYSKDELYAMKYWDIIHPDYHELLREQGKARLLGHVTDPRQLDIPILTKSGEERWITFVSSTVVHKSRVAGLLTAIDITDRKKAEEQLIEREKKYRSIFENQIDLYYQADMNGIIQNLSPSCEKMTGWRPEELIGRHVVDLYPDPGQRKGLLDILLHDGVVYDYQVKLKNKDGKHVPVSINSHVIYDDTGNPVSIEGTIRDFTERKQMEDALKKSEMHYRSLFENMMEGFAFCRVIYDEDENPVDWIYLDVNRAFERLTGLIGVKGKKVTEAIPDIKELSPELFDIYSRVAKTGVPETFEIYFSPLQIWLNISVYCPEKDHFVAVFDNVTKRREAQESLNRLIADHKLILENVPAMIWYKDINNTILKVNSAAAIAFGRPVEEIEGRPYSELFPDLSQKYYEDDLEIFRTGEPKFGILEEFVTNTGEHRWLETDKIPLYDADKKVSGILIVCTDITEEKKAKDAMALANKKLNLMSSITRHDIANQLQGLFFSLEFLKERNTDAELDDFIQKADMFGHNIERQISFTRDYQDIGVKEPRWQDVKRTILRSARSIHLGEIRLHVELSGLEIYADPLLEKVFHNLIDNAVRYGEKLTEIRFYGVEEEGSGYILICEDDGVGVPDELKIAIFRREYFKHTGFGLNLSRDILEITGLTISETGYTGIGARFEIVIPKGEFRLVSEQR